VGTRISSANGSTEGWGSSARRRSDPLLGAPDRPQAVADMTAVLLARLAPAVDGIRVALHVLAASVWVGGQITVAGLVPTARRLGPDAPRLVARAFSRLSWPAYAVLLATGVWNVSAAHAGQPQAWRVVLAVKIAVALIAGLGAWLHSRARNRAAIATWGAVAALSSLAALALGVFLAG
jgi:putative copper export protein